MQRLGYKAGVVFGLLLYAVGALLFYPAAQQQSYPFFLMALFVIASGLAFLETSANPLIVAMGDPSQAARRLNFAQAFNPLGTIMGVYIGREYILSGVEHSEEALASMSPEALSAYYQSEVLAVQGPYLVIACVVLVFAAMVFVTRFPAVANRDGGSAAGRPSDYIQLVKNPRFMSGVLAQFLYVGAQVGIWSYMIRYGQFAVPGTGEKILADYLYWSLVAFLVGRIVATLLMQRIDAAKLMTVFAMANVLLCVVAVASPDQLGLYALAATSFFMSLMFPTIFALAIQPLGPLTKAGSSLLVMAIIGGAVLTLCMGALSDTFGMPTAMLVPLACFVYIALYAWRRRGVQ